MELQLYHSPFQSSVFGKVLGELGRKFVIDVKSEVVSASDDVHVIPFARTDVR